MLFVIQVILTVINLRTVLSTVDEDHTHLNYEIVFPQDSVNTIYIYITPGDWELMMDDMKDLYGEFGAISNYPGNSQRQPPAQPHQSFPQGMMRPPDNLGSEIPNPIWVPCTISFNDLQWESVGIRFKGNSSLSNSWQTGILKLPFKLDFDQFEDSFPETKNQRFYGFKQLSFSSNFRDTSFLREKITAEIFRASGVPAPETAFYEVYINHGDGFIYFGLYTLVEIVEDTVIQTQFSESDGNVYKPLGRAATFQEGSFSETGFDKETNKGNSDWSDIEQLYSIIHSEQRLSNPEKWIQELRTIFDIDSFLLWLAVNVSVENWDTYGRSPHNYFLYNNPESNLLTWIPWDNNMALSNNIGLMPTHSIDLNDITDEWPLIRFLLDIPELENQYFNNLAITLETSFNKGSISARYSDLHQLIEPYALAEETGFTFLGNDRIDDFEESLFELNNHLEERHFLISSFLQNRN